MRDFTINDRLCVHGNARTLCPTCRNAETAPDTPRDKWAELLVAAVKFLNEAPQEGDYALMLLSMTAGIQANQATRLEMQAAYARARQHLLEAIINIGI